MVPSTLCGPRGRAAAAVPVRCGSDPERL